MTINLLLLFRLITTMLLTIIILFIQLSCSLWQTTKIISVTILSITSFYLFSNRDTKNHFGCLFVVRDINLRPGGFDQTPGLLQLLCIVVCSLVRLLSATRTSKMLRIRCIISDGFSALFLLHSGKFSCVVLVWWWWWWWRDILQNREMWPNQVRCIIFYPLSCNRGFGGYGGAHTTKWWLVSATLTN